MKKQWSKSKMEPKTNPNPNQEPEPVGDRDAMTSVLHDSLEMSNTESYLVMELKQSYSRQIVGLAIFVPLLFVAILVYNIIFGDFFHEGGAVPKAVFVSSTMLCFIAVYGVLITNMFRRTSNVPPESRQAIQDTIIKHVDMGNKSDKNE